MVPFAALGALATAFAAAPTATGVRIGDHPAFVRVVVDFRGGALPGPVEPVDARDPDPFNGTAVVRVDQRGIRTRAMAVNSHGVRVRVSQGSGHVTVRLGTSARRFKYLSHDTFYAPERLVIDLWKSRPPVPAAVIRRDPSGCLTLDSLSASGRTVAAAGRERDLFEHSLVVRLRGADGRVLAERPKTGPTWRTRLRAPSVRRQDATFEAAGFSARDGSLICLVQARVRVG
jgi:hypothetical protein